MFGPKTVASILSSFHKTIAKLDKHAAEQDALADLHEDASRRAKLAHFDAKSEAAMARGVRAKLAEVVGA